MIFGPILRYLAVLKSNRGMMSRPAFEFAKYQAMRKVDTIKGVNPCKMKPIRTLHSIDP